MSRRLPVALLLLLSMAHARALEMPDDASGPTCEAYMPLGALAWQRRGGDWTDAAGVAHGPLPFASITVAESSAPMRVTLDVSSLVRRAVARGRRSVTIMLRAAPGAAGQVDFYSREHATADQRPTLTTSVAGQPARKLDAAADTYLDCSSAYSLGAQPVLSVNAQRSSLLRFALPAGSIGAAHLQLTSWRQVAGGVRVDAYEANIPYERASGPARRGLAAGFILDEGIERHADVLFASGFDDWSWPLQWRDATVRSHADLVESDPQQHFVPLIGRALKVRIPRGQQLGLDLRYYFSRHGQPEPEEAYLRYYLRFGHDWTALADGGKLPGLAGTYGRGGWGDRVSNGHNGWSMRMAFAQSLQAPSTVGLTAVGTLACHARIADASCDTWGWPLANGALLGNDRWYGIEQHVKMNTPGKADGVFEAWIDGRLVAANHQVVYRDTPDLKIESAWMDVFHGGTKVAPRELTLYLDAVVLARSYIGPIAGWNAEARGARDPPR